MRVTADANDILTALGLNNGMKIKPLIFACVSIVAGLSSVAAFGATIKVTRKTCNQVVAHQPSADVAYKPGVDVYGKSVASADLNGGTQIAIPKEIVIPITVDLQQRFGRSETDRKYDSDAKIGVVTYRDGQVFYNGKPLQGGQDKAKLAAACKRLLSRIN